MSLTRLSWVAVVDHKRRKGLRTPSSDAEIESPTVDGFGLGRVFCFFSDGEKFFGSLRCIVIHTTSNLSPALPHLSWDDYRTIPSKRFLNHLMVSVWLILWLVPMGFLQRRRLATRSPGRVLFQHWSIVFTLIENSRLLTCSSRSPCRRYQYRGRT